ncbi:MAG: polysaccharide biosynthesis tyrosine autokinase, partial [Okeania sp. SIO2D1]|nr:polysaccharide biosynthesis tyrosine autokinase [Okeania sp. SIO2D1]
LLAGAGAATLAEKLDNKFHSPDELKQSTGLPILGTIPFQKELKDRKKSNIPQMEPLATSPCWEACLSLQTNISFVSPDTPLRYIVISSAVPSEGKSTIALYLAQAAAAIGKKVLLVDADLRRPQVHVRTDLPNTWGLSNLIFSNIDLSQAIQVAPFEENLSILTSGQVPPNPTRALSSQKMGSLLERLQRRFDLIIFDTPPLTGLADAKLLAPRTDGMVMVVGLGMTERSIFQRALDELKIARVPVLGLVANGVKGYTPNYSTYYKRYYHKTAKFDLMENIQNFVSPK